MGKTKSREEEEKGKEKPRAESEIVISAQVAHPSPENKGL